MTLFQAIANNDLIAVQTSLEKGADLSACDEDGYTPLVVAARDDNCTVEMLQLLVSFGADVNAVMHEGYAEGHSVLMIVVFYADLDKIRFLINAGADVHFLNSEGENILFYAIRSGEISPENLMPLLEMLLACGASLHCDCEWRDSVLGFASYMGRFDAVQRIIEAGGDAQELQWDALMTAVALGTVEDVEHELAPAVDLTAVDALKRPALHLAVYSGELEKVRLLYIAGADLNSRGHHGERPLMIAIEKRFPDIFEWLIENKVDVNALDSYGKPSLAWAASEGLSDYVHQLLQAGADAELSVPYGACEGYEEILEEVSPGFKEMGPQERAEYLAHEAQLIAAMPIEYAFTPEVVLQLVAAGANLSKIRNEMRAELLGLEYRGEIDCSEEDYWAAKSPINGTANPEKMEFRFWDAMIKSGARADAARMKFEGDVSDAEYYGIFEDEDGIDDDDSEGYGIREEDDGELIDEDEAEDERPAPVWCYDRSGRSLTLLPDGRIIEIGGQNDFAHLWERDHYVHNDVIVHYGDGRFDIYGYPEEVFAYTSNHSATLVGDAIYIIGCLGYEEDRVPGYTPVYRLNCQTYAIEKLETSGDCPGWIIWHRDKLHPSKGENGEIHIQQGEIYELDEDGDGKWDKNEDVFILDLHTLRWRRKNNNE